ncbi:hypothetical protein [Chryseobacterium sp. JK1]|uniref:hypothetical protein n=1 Tax=Chryseobacterium sp. JK1 TaxID=874294 RepID=UPI003D690788
MGVGFVIVLHLFLLSVVGFIVGIVSSVVTYFAGKKERRRSKVVVAFMAPFAFLYTFYIGGLIGVSILADRKNVDIGIGDDWHVPLENNHILSFLELDEPGAIVEKSGRSVVWDVVAIEEKGNQVVGKRENNQYFSYDTQTNEVHEFNTESELKAASNDKEIKLMNVSKFYSEKKSGLISTWEYISIAVFSLLISVGAINMTKHIVFFTGEMFARKLK